MKFNEEEAATKNVIKNKKKEIKMGAFWSTYLLKKIPELGWGKILTEIAPEWLTAAVLINASDMVEIQATKTQQLNWWSFGLELFLLISEEELLVIMYRMTRNYKW